MSLRIFILEDEIGRAPRNQILEALASHTLETATSYLEAVQRYCSPYDLLLLDHDMEGFFERSDHPNTGHQFCKWLVKQELKKRPQVVLHSQNPVGRKNMRLLLEENEFSVQECPFGPEYIRFLRTI